MHILLVGLLLLMSSCAKSVDSETSAPAPRPTLAEAGAEPANLPMGTSEETPMNDLSAGLNAFALDMYRQLAPAHGNLIFSPASISVAMAMTHAGCRGDTATEIARTLRFGKHDSGLHAAFGKLQSSWSHTDKKVQVALANRLFGEKTQTYKKAFRDLCKKDFDAPMELLNFVEHPEAARKHINLWVESKTEQRIKNLLPPSAISPGTRIVLVNAIYFKGLWTHRFDKSNTRTGTFVTDEGRSVRVPMMHATHRFGFSEFPDDKIKVLRAPYGDDERFAMFVVLPNEPTGLAALEKRMTPGKLATWFAAVPPQKVDVALPKFRIAPKHSIDLVKAFQALGLHAPFAADTADMTGITTTQPPMFIGGILHKAFVEVDEQGTEAAAATAVVVKTGGLSMPVQFHAIHPFLFFIIDTKTGANLFFGRLGDPGLAY